MYFFNDTICLIIFLDSLQNDFFKKTEIPELIGVFMALFCSSCSTSKVGICWDDEKWPSHGQAW